MKLQGSGRVNVEVEGDTTVMLPKHMTMLSVAQLQMLDNEKLNLIAIGSKPGSNNTDVLLSTGDVFNVPIGGHALPSNDGRGALIDGVFVPLNDLLKDAKFISVLFR